MSITYSTQILAVSMQLILCFFLFIYFSELQRKLDASQEQNDQITEEKMKLVSSVCVSIVPWGSVHKVIMAVL